VNVSPDMLADRVTNAVTYSADLECELARLRGVFEENQTLRSEVTRLKLAPKGQHADVVNLLDRLRDHAKAFGPKTRATFESVTDSIETLTRAYMVPDVKCSWTAYQLTPSEASVADLLFRRLGAVCSKEQMLDVVYYARPNEVPELKILDVYVCKIRSKFAHFRAPYKIETARAIGYRMVDCPQDGEYQASPYREVKQPRHTTVEWNGLQVPDWAPPALDLLSSATRPVTAEALSVAAGRSVSDFQNRLRKLREVIAGEYVIFNLRAMGYTMSKVGHVSSTIEALKAA
jgi:DNA-binding winged helix-turn-helix (wHTH) protein